MQSKPCLACGKPFQPRPQRPDQCFCPASVCQRERKRRWQRAKLRTDPDYRANQSQAQRSWAQRHSEYWRRYREAHPAYCDANRTQQARRDGRVGGLAKMDVSTRVPSGTYLLQPLQPVIHHSSELAKMDVWTVEITVLSGP